MDIFNTLIVNIIYIIFPILCYLFYVSYNEAFSKKNNYLFLEIALFTSVYLCIEFGHPYVMLFNIPLLLAYRKERGYCGIILSLIISYYCIDVLKFNSTYIILEYILFYVIFLLSKNNKKLKKNYTYIFIMLCMVFQFIYGINNGYLTLVSVFTFPIISLLIIKLLYKAESIASIHASLSKIEEYKQVRESLFKITHEIKNPIAVCKGYLDMFDKNNPKHVDKFIPIIKNEIDRTLTIMNDFMEFSKIKLDLDIMDIELLLEEVLDSLSSLIDSKEIKLCYDLKDDEIFIKGDYNRLKQVFINVFKNSIEALESKKEGKIEINYKTTSKNIIISINDNGIGMDEETLNRIYEAFYTTKKYGTGLGVSLSKEIIDGHHGKIEYSSTLNKGTKVQITLPLVSF